MCNLLTSCLPSKSLVDTVVRYTNVTVMTVCVIRITVCKSVLRRNSFNF